MTHLHSMGGSYHVGRDFGLPRLLKVLIDHLESEIDRLWPIIKAKHIKPESLLHPMYFPAVVSPFGLVRRSLSHRATVGLDKPPIDVTGPHSQISGHCLGGTTWRRWAVVARGPRAIRKRQDGNFAVVDVALVIAVGEPRCDLSEVSSLDLLKHSAQKHGGLGAFHSLSEFHVILPI